MNSQSELAHAKINLALHITGKRADGYHELDSLVVFAAVADVVSTTMADALSLTVRGHDADALQAEQNNSVMVAARALLDYADAEKINPTGTGAEFILDKNLPVEAGIGGGSADAAATLRALNQLWNLQFPQHTLEQIGAKLGADVAICVGSQTCRMGGIGERLEPLRAGHMPRLDLVLVNPGLAVSTPDVFRALENPSQSALPAFPRDNDLSSWLAWLSTSRNDLFQPARGLCPDIDQVISELDNSGARMSRMSGSGATCFGIFEDRIAAHNAVRNVRNSHPNWWVRATQTV